MGKVILVTGGNRGIGLEICRQLGNLGHMVIMGVRHIESGKEQASKLHMDVEVVLLDVTKVNHIENLFKLISEKHGKLDVLINNAGIGIGNKGTLDAELDEVKEIMETNFYGPWRLNQAMLPLLHKSEDGRIINMSSGMGALADLTGGYAGYRMSKSALNALTILTSNELANTSIKVNAMCPGWVKTDMGGEGASRTVEQGADTAVWLAIKDDIPNGKFLRDKKIISW